MTMSLYSAHTTILYVESIYLYILVKEITATYIRPTHLAEILIDPLVHIFKLSLTTGVVSDY